MAVSHFVCKPLMESSTLSPMGTKPGIKHHSQARCSTEFQLMRLSVATIVMRCRDTLTTSAATGKNARAATIKRSAAAAASGRNRAKNAGSKVNQQPAKMWSGRFREPLNRTFDQCQRSMSFISLVLCAGCLICLSTRSAAAQPGKCSQRTLDHLEAESENIREWSQLRSLFHRYRPCQVDHAGITAGVSESVARLLVDHWDSLPKAHRLFVHDPAFESFALAGINITDRTEDLNRIDELATKQCPLGLHALCQKIRKAIVTNQ